MTAKPRVLLTDLKNANIPAEIPHLFHRAGIALDVYCSEQSWLLKSRYRHLWHRADISSPAAYAGGLAPLIASDDYAWIVFMDDFSLRAAHDHLDDRLAQKALPVTSLSHKALTSSKVALSVLSKRHGIQTPRFSVHKGTGDIRKSTESVPFPLLFKADRSGGGKGIRLCANKDELVKAYESLREDQRDNLLIQEYIDGENVSCEALYHDGRLIAHARSRVLQNIGGEFSVSSVREYIPDKNLESDLVRIGAKLGLNGFCSFTFIYAFATQTHYLVEADLRTHAWFALSRFAGVDFSEAIKQRLLGIPFTQEQRTTVIRHFSRDITSSILSGNIGNLAAWISNSDGRWRFVSTHDRQLLRATIQDMCRTIIFGFKPTRMVGGGLAKIWRTCARAPRILKQALLKLDELNLLGFSLTSMRSERKLIGLGVLLSLLQTATLVPIPFFTKTGFDAIVSEQNARLLIYSLGSATALLVIGTALALVHRHVTLKATKSIMSSLRSRILSRTLSRDYAFFATEDLDAAHSKIVQDTERLDRMANRFLAQVLPALLAALGLSCVLVYLNPRLSLIMAAFLPALYFIGRHIGRKVRASVDQFHSDFNDFSTGVSFILKFHELISISGMAQDEFLRQEAKVQALQRSSARTAWLSTLYGTLQSNVIVMCGALILVIGGFQILNGAASVGSVLSFYIALGLISSNARIILSGVPTFIEGGRSLQSLAPYLAETVKTPDGLQGEYDYPVEFRSVSFGYGSDNILENVTFKIDRGSVTGFFGASGSGKTTIARLLLGLYFPTQGEVLIQGQDIRKLDLTKLRSFIGLLPQEPAFFPGTILENLRYGINADKEAVIQMCSLCQIHETISKLPRGYDSVIGHRGVTLSGGEKQRIAIARALLRKPGLLILDEPDNNLDEEFVLGILNKAKALGHTIILITHNRSLQKFVDTALIVSNQKVVTQEPRHDQG